MATTISSELKLNVVLDSALVALREALLPLNSFSTVYNSVPLQGTDKIAVPFYPLATDSTSDFSGTYSFGDSNAINSREITVNKRKYQALSFTSAELARQPYFNPEQLGFLKGRKLAEDILRDILSVVTAANYGSAIHTGAAATFDSDDMISMKTVLDQSKWAKTSRVMVLDNAYEGALLKDASIKNAAAVGSASAIQNGRLPQIAGFDVVGTNLVPDNGENLVGMVALPEAMLVAFSPVQPSPGVRNNLTAYETAVDPETGLTIEYRSWGDPDTDMEKSVIEVNYGFAKGHEAALKRIVSA
ncbi:MAG: hypothetical protein ACO3L2_10285 [Chthoniobacterales bacterium]